MIMCGRCLSKDPGRIIIKFDKKSKKIEYCARCADISIGIDSGYTDAHGNKISLDSSIIGKFSYAIGEPILSKQQYSEVLKRENLVQTGTGYFTGKKHPLKNKET